MPNMQKRGKFQKDLFMNIEEFNNAIKGKATATYHIKEDEDSYGNPVVWVELTENTDAQVIAKTVKAYKGRCITATAYKNDDDTHSIIYHFDIAGMIVNMQVNVSKNDTFYSVTPILPSANWAEREIREMFSLEPVGHPNKDRLFLDYSIAKGVLNKYIPLSKMQRGVSKSDISWEQVNKEIAK